MFQQKKERKEMCFFINYQYEYSSRTEEINVDKKNFSAFSNPSLLHCVYNSEEQETKVKIQIR